MPSLYKEFEAKYKNCTACDLCKTRKNVVLARGVVPCEVLFIGEAPGPSEDLIGKPFIGPAGKFLDSLLNRAGFNEQVPIRCAWTNLVCCIPRDEGGDKFTEPPDYAIEACTPRLAAFIKLARPKVIVCVGKQAAEWIPHLDIMPKVDIIHPAAILRMAEPQRSTAIERTQIALEDLLVEYLVEDET